ncbi:MAG: penicillin-binding protein activator [Steroidobacteraceae bacterium]
MTMPCITVCAARPPLPRTARTLLALGLLLLAAGCTSLAPGQAPASLDRAEALLRDGRAAPAASEFERLAAQNAPAAAYDFKLRAVRAWARAARPGDARRVLAAADADVAAGYAPTATQRSAREIARIEILLAEGQAQAAWAQLAAVPEPGEPRVRDTYLDLRQRLAFATARPVDAIRTEIAREAASTDADTRLRLRRELYAQLRSAAERGVRLDPAAAGADGTLRGWLELGPLAAQAQRGGTAPALAAWRARYPTHPAAELVRAEIVAATGSAPMGRSDHIAVLLPLSGRAASASAQVRDGLLAGMYSAPEPDRPELRFYDTEELGVDGAVGQALAAGADFVVGPLLREEVSAAADLLNGRATTLALNYLPSDRAAPAGFYQYALSPEDDARLVARRILADGRRRGVALVPAGDWGPRVLTAFQDELLRGGGELLDSAEYEPAENDYSAPIQSVLRLADSRGRAWRLGNALGTKLEFLPRRRGDIDFIFAPAPAATARLLRPQLRFHYAGDIPAYATSDSYEPGLTANQDREGLLFPDMPWVLSDGPGVEKLRAATSAAFGDAARSRGKLYAFGHDAWLLAVALRNLGGTDIANLRIEGATGVISFDEQGRTRRELEWAQVRGGSARLLTAGAD